MECTWLTLVNIAICLFSIVAIAQRPPQLMSKYQNQYVIPLGSKLNVVCPIESASFYEWKHKLAPEKFLSRVRNWTHVATKVTESNNEAEYICNGINGFGTTGVSIFVHVVDLKSPFIEDRCYLEGSSMENIGPCFVQNVLMRHMRVQVDLGQSIQLDCSAVSNRIGPINYYWTFQKLRPLGWPNLMNEENTNMGENEQLLHRQRSTLFVQTTSKDDLGNYTCTADQDGYSIRRSFLVQVASGSPDPTKQLESRMKNITTIEGRDVSLVCDTSSSHTIENSDVMAIKWLKRLEAQDDTKLIEKERLITSPEGKFLMLSESGSSTPLRNLLIRQVKRRDQGQYLCSVLSKSGKFQNQLINLVVILNNKESSNGGGTSPSEEGNPNEGKNETVESGFNARLVAYVSMPLFVLILCSFFLVYCGIQRRRRHRNPNRQKPIYPSSTQCAYAPALSSPSTQPSGLFYPHSSQPIVSGGMLPSTTPNSSVSNPYSYYMPLSSNQHPVTVGSHQGAPLLVGTSGSSTTAMGSPDTNGDCSEFQLSSRGGIPHPPHTSVTATSSESSAVPVLCNGNEMAGLHHMGPPKGPYMSHM